MALESSPLSSSGRPVSGDVPAPLAPQPGQVMGHIDVRAVALRGDAGEQGARLTWARCERPAGALVPTELSTLVPLPARDVARWEACWADDEAYVLHGIRGDGADDEWYALSLEDGHVHAAPAEVPFDRASAPLGEASLTPRRRARPRTALVAVRRMGRARGWSVVWRA